MLASTLGSANTRPSQYNTLKFPGANCVDVSIAVVIVGAYKVNKFFMQL